MTRIKIQREGANFSSMPPVRHEFHWLPVQARMHFKILLLAFKAIHGLASSYISDLLAFKASPLTILHPTRAFYYSHPRVRC